MAEIDLGPGFGSISSHDVEERIKVSKPFSTTLEVEREAGGDIVGAVLLVSMKTGRSIYNSRLKIAVNGFSISRIARPVNELQLQNAFHSIFVYDLTPIKSRLQDRAEIDIESRDLDILVDGISLIAIYPPNTNAGYVESQNKVYIGPYILRGGERIYLNARSFGGGDLTIGGIVIPIKKADIKLSLSMNKAVRRLSINSPTELSLRLCGTIADGKEEVELESGCLESECMIKIPWVFIGTSSKKSPEYVIGDIELSPEGRELLVEFENRGDFEAKELNVVAIWRGTVIGRAVEKPSRRGVVRVPLNMGITDIEKRSQESPAIVVRIIWRWMGVVEGREKIFRPSPRDSGTVST
ncbi:MAG TPA: hypothetical protein VNL13_05460 [Sulfolobales archaeon]|nr:hypothetical protein [Sulfolobales archaeon]